GTQQDGFNGVIDLLLVRHRQRSPARRRLLI
ncbi:MAG: hypothetical protein ACI814_003271, partial [Mariniblastus sp.]